MNNNIKIISDEMKVDKLIMTRVGPGRHEDEE